MKETQDLIGRTFGYLKVLNFVGIESVGFKGHKRAIWLCECKCGSIVKRVKSSLINKRMGNQSCGCIKNNTGKANLMWKGYKDISATFWSNIINCARHRNLSFDLTIEQAWDLYEKQHRECALSGMAIKFSMSSLRARLTSASLDRIDSRIGYLPDNVQWVHKDINRMKNNFEEHKFIYLCQQIAKRRG